MTRTERQQLAIEKWKEAGCRGSIIATTGFGLVLAIKVFRIIYKNIFL